MRVLVARVPWLNKRGCVDLLIHIEIELASVSRQAPPSVSRLPSYTFGALPAYVEVSLAAATDTALLDRWFDEVMRAADVDAVNWWGQRAPRGRY